MQEDDSPEVDPAARQAQNAARALAEAQARRAEIDRKAADAAKEKGGRGGLDPARFGDWEVKGVATDF